MANKHIENNQRQAAEAEDHHIEVEDETIKLQQDLAEARRDETSKEVKTFRQRGNSLVEAERLHHQKDHMKLNLKGGDTKDCPFDCQCCF